jgi:hypothetical protein
MGVATRPDERQGGTLDGEGNRATGVGRDRALEPADDSARRSGARARAGCKARAARAARHDLGQEAEARLQPGAAGARPLRDADRGRRVPGRRCAAARRLGPGAAARARRPDPTTLGRFLASFSLGHICQLNRCLDELFARVLPLLDREQVTLDLDSTLVEHHGPAGSRQGARGTYVGKVAWHPLLAFVAETGEWLHGKLRNGHAAPSTGARRFLVECLDRVPPGARLALRADEGFYGQDFLADLERKGVTYAVGAPLIASVRARIGEIAEEDWRPSSYREGSEVASFLWGRRRGRSSGASSSAATPSRQASSSRSRTGSGTTGCSSRTTGSAPPTSSSPGTAPRPTSRTGSRRRSSGSGSTTSPASASTPTGRLPALHAARLRPALLAQVARPAAERARKLREAAALSLHQRRRHRRPLRPPPRPAPLRRLRALRRLHPSAAADPAARASARLTPPLLSQPTRRRALWRSHLSEAIVTRPLGLARRAGSRPAAIPMLRAKKAGQRAASAAYRRIRVARRELDRGRGGPSGVPGGLKDAQLGPYLVVFSTTCYRQGETTVCSPFRRRGETGPLECAQPLAFCCCAS